MIINPENKEFVMNIGNVNSGSNVYGNYGSQLKTQAEPVAQQGTLKTEESQGGGGAQITALAKANEIQKNIIDLFA